MHEATFFEVFDQSSPGVLHLLARENWRVLARALQSCAIYTRVSIDAMFDQEFNSLDAQYDASEANIRSQAHANWTLIKMRYDDGGFSGGSTDRPALQKQLDDVRARKISVIVVIRSTA